MGVALAFAFLSGRLVAQNSFDGFPSGTISTVIALHLGEVQAISGTSTSPGIVTSSETFPRATTVTFLGRTRPLSAAHRRVLVQWFHAAFAGDTSNIAQFREDWLFREGRRTIWLPMQVPVAASARRSLKAKQPAVVFVRWFGVEYRGTQLDWVFPVLAMQTPE